MMPASRSRPLLPLIVVSALAFLALDATGFGPFGAVRRTVLLVGQPIRELMSTAVAPVSSTWDGAVHYDEVVAENGELRRQIAELEGQTAGQADAAAELQDLLEATEISYRGDIDRVTSRVIADRRTEVERVVELDKGSNHGIARGMPVVTGRGLVGTVEVVTGERSTVRLITDGDVSVGIRSAGGIGLAIGRRSPEMELLASPELAEAIRVGAVVDGQRFVTSGIDRSLYPSGIPVGRLVLDPSSAERDPTDFDPSDQLSPAGPAIADQSTLATQQAITLQPFADIEHLSFLTVLLIGPDA